MKLKTMTKVILELKGITSLLKLEERKMEACSLMVCAVELFLRPPNGTTKRTCREILSTLYSMRSFQKKMARKLARLQNDLKSMDGKREH